jgi:tetratricopeptide (TPR) repeat protein
MNELLGYLQTGKLHWLTVPRYAIVALPLTVATGLAAAGAGWWVLPLWVVAALGLARLVWFKQLPHEKARLASAKAALAAAKPDLAISILQRPLSLGGRDYQLDRAALLAQAHTRQGNFIEAHRSLSAVDANHLLPDERLRLHRAWAGLFLEAGNPAEAQRRLAELPEKECIADVGCLLLKAELALQHDELPQARSLLESGLDRADSAAQRMRLLNNLARIDLMQGRFDAQLRRLQAALAEFRKAPQVDLTDVIHHNLAIALVRANQPEEASAVLSEAWAVGDKHDLHHVITVLNNHLHAAREAGDAAWKREVYEEFQRQLTRLAPRTPRERLALDVTTLRARRNDGLALAPADYPVLIDRLLETSQIALPAIPTSDCVAALVEIRHDLHQELATAGSDNERRRLVAQLQCAARQLLEHRPTIDAHLATLSPLLLGPLNTWHSYRTDTDKAEIELANQPQALQAGVARLFEHLREKAQWLTEQGTRRQAITAWLVICDEYQAYRQQMPPATALHLLEGQRQPALQALDRASALLRQSKSTKQHIDHMIGLAYFHLQLRQDFTEAAHWQQQIDAHQPALDHFAGWLREHHAFVCAALREVSPSAPAGHLHPETQSPAARRAPVASPQGAPLCTG